MDIREKIIPYIPKGSRKTETVDGKTFEIRNTKQEETFLSFSQTNSPLNKLCWMASEDPLLRVLFFIKPDIGIQWNEEYPVLLRYPIFVDFNQDFLASISEGSAKNKMDDFKKKKTESEKNAEDLSSRMMWKLFSIAIGDKQIKDKLRRRKLQVKEDEVNSLFSVIAERHKNQFSVITRDMIDVFGSLTYSLEFYSPLLRAFEKAEEAKDNLSLLSLAVVGKDIAKDFSHSISKLIAQRIFLATVNSFCMECLPQRGYEPYNVSVKYPAEPLLESTCKKCGGKTIFHLITLDAPSNFGPLFEENRLPEFIIGFSLAASEKIKKVYIHKNIHVVDKTGPLSGQEVDVFAITNNNKIIIAEITTSKDLNKVWETIHAKEERFKNIPYDALVFLTSSLAIDEYPRLGDKIRVFGARHIPDILDNIEYLIDEISSK